MRDSSQKSEVGSRKIYGKKADIFSHTRHLSSSGFTLFEVIVAVAILGISLVMVMQLFSAGLRSARTSCDYTKAVVHAKDIMESLSRTLDNGSGEFEDGFSWESEIEDYKEIEETEYKLLKLKVKVYWPDVMQKQRAFELVSLKMIDHEDQL